ncbi:GntR family transcriptional regulator [Pseudorhodoferax sp. Leaf274]|uniref:GntR family transcriptional regulator n=1 Tax=Pseudorhodoferax sp. Leaf274 TaxID=1736318 RepID=UPI0009E9D534|nr:GntR family transcriptional regulator [Pseudorhodoferax sp. Leaf274]
MVKKAAAPKRRDADLAFEAIEAMISTMGLPPGSPIVEAEISERIAIGRTPVREALMRLMSIGLIVQQPRRGLLVSPIDLANHLDVILTRRVLERVIASCSARRANAAERQQIADGAERMVAAAARDDLKAYMRADHDLDAASHAASRNASAVTAVVPLVTQCRRFWYAYQHAGEIAEGARCHALLAQGIANGSEAEAVQGADALMDYLEAFTRRVIDN